MYTGIVCIFGLILVSVTFFFDFRYDKADGKAAEVR